MIRHDTNMSRRDYRLQAGVKPLQVNDKQSSAEGAAHASSVWDDTKGGAAYGLEIIFIINAKNFIYNFKYEF